MRFLRIAAALAVATWCVLSSTSLAADSEPSRQKLSLNGEWRFQREGEPSGPESAVQVPSAFQDHEGTNFHGIGIYRKTVAPFAVPPGRRVLLHFQAAATQAEVWWNGERLGTHLGGWTPFRFDITELLKKASPGQSHEIRVRLDEKPGHNTQGFLPVIAPHFGGLWQDVSLLTVPEVYIDDILMSLKYFPDEHEAHLKIIDPQVCINCQAKPCTQFCPVGA